MGLEEPQSQVSETQSTQSSEQIPKLKIGDYIQIYNDDGSVKGIYNIKDISDGKYTLVDSEGNEVEYDVNQIDSDLGNKYKPVSYTHLDVYKRQEKILSINLIIVYQIQLIIVPLQKKLVILLVILHQVLDHQKIHYLVIL